MATLLPRRCLQLNLTATQLYRRHLATSDWRLIGNGVRVRDVSFGNQEDEPVQTGQAVRVEFVARVDDGTEVAAKVVSFKLGNGAVCQAIEEGVPGMRVGDRRKLRAPQHLPRASALEKAPKDAVRLC